MRDARRSTTTHAGGLVCLPPFAASWPLSAATPRSKPNRVSWRSDSRAGLFAPALTVPGRAAWRGSPAPAILSGAFRRSDRKRHRRARQIWRRAHLPGDNLIALPRRARRRAPPRLQQDQRVGPIGDSFSPSSVDSLSGVRRPSRSESLGSDQQRLRPARLRRSCRQGQGRSTGQTSGADVRTVHRAAEAALPHGAAARVWGAQSRFMRRGCIRG